MAGEWKVDRDLATRVESRIEVKGELKLIDSSRTAKEDLTSREKQVVTRLPLQVAAQLRFSESPLQIDDAAVLRFASRQYEIATATLNVGKGTLQSELAKPHRTIVVEQRPDNHRLFSPGDALTRDELDLIDTPFDAALLPSLLPEDESPVPANWTPRHEIWAQLLRWEVVTEADVKVKIASEKDGVVHCEFSGKLTGGVDGVTTEASLEGKFDFSRSEQIISWLAVVIRENRTASQGVPGFETTTRIRTSLAKAEPGENRVSLEKLDFGSDDTTRLLRFRSQQGDIEFLYQPAWRVVTDQPELTVLRYLQGGEVLAQCNLSPLPPLAAGEQLTLEGYQAHLRQSLRNKLGDVLEAGEQLNENRVRVLRVVASGMVDELPIQWVFYHLSNDRGQRTTIAITVSADQFERFAHAEQTLIATFDFRNVAASGKTASQAQRPTGSVKSGSVK